MSGKLITLVGRCAVALLAGGAVFSAFGAALWYGWGFAVWQLGHWTYASDVVGKLLGGEIAATGRLMGWTATMVAAIAATGAATVAIWIGGRTSIKRAVDGLQTRRQERRAAARAAALAAPATTSETRNSLKARLGQGLRGAWCVVRFPVWVIIILPLRLLAQLLPVPARRPRLELSLGLNDDDWDHQPRPAPQLAPRPPSNAPPAAPDRPLPQILGAEDPVATPSPAAAPALAPEGEPEGKDAPEDKSPGSAVKRLAAKTASKKKPPAEPEPEPHAETMAGFEVEAPPSKPQTSDGATKRSAEGPAWLAPMPRAVIDQMAQWLRDQNWLVVGAIQMPPAVAVGDSADAGAIIPLVALSSTHCHVLLFAAFTDRVVTVLVDGESGWTWRSSNDAPLECPLAWHQELGHHFRTQFGDAVEMPIVVHTVLHDIEGVDIKPEVIDRWHDVHDVLPTNDTSHWNEKIGEGDKHVPSGTVLALRRFSA